MTLTGNKQTYQSHSKPGTVVESQLNIQCGICDADTDTSPFNVKTERAPDKLVHCLKVFYLLHAVISRTNTICSLLQILSLPFSHPY
jgi:hypothetical protein